MQNWSSFAVEAVLTIVQNLVFGGYNDNELSHNNKLLHEFVFPFVFAHLVLS